MYGARRVEHSTERESRRPPGLRDAPRLVPPLGERAINGRRADRSDPGRIEASGGACPFCVGTAALSDQTVAAAVDAARGSVIADLLGEDFALVTTVGLGHGRLLERARPTSQRQMIQLPQG